MSSAYTDDDFKKFRDFVRLRTGIFFHDAKKQDLMRIIQRKTAESGFPHIRDYYKALHSPESDPLLDERLINAVTIGETYFFRYKEQWRLLESSLLPELVVRKREQGSRQIRIWSAGCSTGEEPYSLAITLMELLGEVQDWKIYIIATDINLASLQSARMGIYTKWSFRSTPPEKVVKYFKPMADKFQIIKPVRDRVVFNPLNLVADDYPSIGHGIHDMDFILCRNVLIYFDEDRIREISHRFCDTLVEGGYLLLGHSEPTHLVSKRLRQVNDRGLIFFQRPVATTVIPLMPAETKSVVAPKPAVPPPPPAPATPPDTGPLAEARILFATGRGEEALSALLPLATKGTFNSLLYLLIAEIYAGSGKYEEAGLWIHRLLQADGLNVEAYRMCSMISEATGHVEEALDYARKGLFLDADSILLLYQLGCLYRRTGESRKAEKCYKSMTRLIEKLPDDTLIGEGERVSVGQLKDALRTLLR